MANDKYKHIFLKDSRNKLHYTARSKRVESIKPVRDRVSHGRELQRQYDIIQAEVEENIENRNADSLLSKKGIYLEFQSLSNYDLTVKSLEDIKQGIRLCNVKTVFEDEKKITFATIFVPKGKEYVFLNKLKSYVNTEKDLKSGKPSNSTLINSIQNIKIALLKSFWRDGNKYLPLEEPAWCEVWLRSNKDSIELDKNSFNSICDLISIPIKKEYLYFPERLVLLIKANSEQLTELIEICPDIAEFRLAKETASFWVSEPNADQSAWVKDLEERTVFDENSIVSICILDTGVNNGHELLKKVLLDSDRQSWDPNWSANDVIGHGTQMCGLTTYGEFQKAVDSSGVININHLMESVKILPDIGRNNSILHGAITQESVNKAEINVPDRIRILCMAVTTDDYECNGHPSSWSGAIDQITSGSEEEGQPRRLFIVSAGNLRDPSDWSDYPDSNKKFRVEDPAQSWNALTVGAFTDLVRITDPNLSSYKIIASKGGLSPFSRTSSEWEKEWPFKPDIVMEGGNAIINNNGFSSICDDLSLLTTSHEPINRQFDSFNMTSAATALASNMAAQLQVSYPDAWPETIRGLMVHSAEWTDEMKKQFLDNSNKTSIAKLMRVVGYGVPNLERAQYCLNNSLTLIAQETIQPFGKKEKSNVIGTQDMHIHKLPWPQQILQELGEKIVTVRITLSYFIEPGPGEVGWKDKYLYPSYAFRFDMNTPQEKLEQFEKRINRERLDDGEELETSNNTGRWKIGLKNRVLGSVHSDYFTGTASDIAECNFVGIYPVNGWWRNRAHLGKWDKQARYSLIVSLHTDEEEIDIYIPVYTLVNVPITIDTSNR